MATKKPPVKKPPVKDTKPVAAKPVPKPDEFNAVGGKCVVCGRASTGPGCH